MLRLLAVLAVALAPLGAARAGGDVVSYATDASFEDAVFEVETAIENRGMVIDYVSHVGEMLNRTAADVGAETDVFVAADVFLFCSSIHSRKVMEADPLNIAHCPYGIFVIQQAGEGAGVEIGYRRMPEGPMKDIEALLDEIAREAAGDG